MCAAAVAELVGGCAGMIVSQQLFVGPTAANLLKSAEVSMHAALNPKTQS